MSTPRSTLPLARVSLALASLFGSSTTFAQSEPTVVELFTSEGCSSCPPAEALIGRLAQQRDIIALSMHVDYWDELGWRDRFALPEAVQRQRAYARTLGLSTIYTPQIVVDGQRDVLAGDFPRLKRPAVPATVPLTLNIVSGALQVRVGAARSADAAACDVLLLGYLPEATSKVTRGENAGRELKEFNVVRSVRPLGTYRGAEQQFTVALATLPSEVTGAAVLVQRQGQGAIVAAAAQALR